MKLKTVSYDLMKVNDALCVCEFNNIVFLNLKLLFICFNLSKFIAIAFISFFFGYVECGGRI